MSVLLTTGHVRLHDNRYIEFSFRLSLAYRALERQEMVAGKPSLTPQKIRKRRQRHAQHHDKPVHKETGTNELEKARQKLKSNTQVRESWT